MSSSIPIVRQFSWASLLTQILVITALGFVAYLVGLNEILIYTGFAANFIWGAVGHLCIWFLVRNTILKDHAKGVSLVKQKDFVNAIPLFKSSLETLDKNPWLDRFRYLLGSSSKISYKEMDLNNIAFCYSQIGDKTDAILFYKRTLSEFPDSEMAKTALTFIDTMTKDELDTHSS
jgi:tetratricopeptide (TPR) repeat protein